MVKKIIIISVVILIVGVLGFLIFSKMNPQRSSESAPPTVQVTSENSVKYTDSGFSPKELKISVGSTVTFINDSRSALWVASNPHPIHTDYFGFDSRKSIDTGDTYQFTFNKTGTFGFHNHLLPETSGVIIVE